ncbi:16S rRNA (guanine(527)-N(7))-methyltransferase RsmG [Sulfitobacter porphyrae]|uniref:Ribosomal RNA small subunit methyltransferase G n=1 Tax=Sulfitobacter porphyrae TaxID=1246864 RepID=A0ABW2AYM9_9RHOB
MTSLDGLNVSRETTVLLTQFSELVERWTVRINLISKASVDGIWERHVADSAQLFELAPEFEHWVDLGSGGGFPGIVIAIIAKEARPEARITLVESDLRKATFLRTAIRELGLNAKVIAERSKGCRLWEQMFSQRGRWPICRPSWNSRICTWQRAEQLSFQKVRTGGKRMKPHDNCGHIPWTPLRVRPALKPLFC